MIEVDKVMRSIEWVGEGQNLSPRIEISNTRDERGNV